MTDETLDELRPRLVEAMLPHVAFDGWSAASVRAGAADAGIDPDVAALAFPGGAVDMAVAHTALADARMAAALAGAPPMKVRERITRAVRLRFEQAEGEREAVRRTLAVLALHPATAARTGWATADAIWRACGDTATDFNHYTKRATLAAVYTATLFYWLADDSAGRAETWAFLDRRIAGIMAFEGAKARARDAAAKLPDLAQLLGRLRYPAV